MQSRYFFGLAVLFLGTALLIGFYASTGSVQAGGEQAAYSFSIQNQDPDTPTPGFTPPALGPDAVPERRPSLLVGASVIALVILLGLVVYKRQQAHPE
jgi:hypothetical protein